MRCGVHCGRGLALSLCVRQQEGIQPHQQLSLTRILLPPGDTWLCMQTFLVVTPGVLLASGGQQYLTLDDRAPSIRSSNPSCRDWRDQAWPEGLDIFLPAQRKAGNLGQGREVTDQSDVPLEAIQGQTSVPPSPDK